MVEQTEQHTKKLYINYGSFSVIVDELINKIKNLDFRYVLGLPRGGLPLAVIISNTFDKQLIDEQMFDLITDKSKVLIVDDICDTGNTFNQYINKSKLPFITLVAKFKGKSKIDNLIYGRLVSDDTWVIFPWEQFEVK